jgi:hypothetical protein
MARSTRSKRADDTLGTYPEGRLITPRSASASLTWTRREAPGLARWSLHRRVAANDPEHDLERLFVNEVLLVSPESRTGALNRCAFLLSEVGEFRHECFPVASNVGCLA